MGTSVNKIPAIARRSKSSRPTLFFSVFLLRSCHRCISHRTISGTSPRYRFSTTHSVLSATRFRLRTDHVTVWPALSSHHPPPQHPAAGSGSPPTVPAVKRNIPENSAIRPDDFAWHRERSEAPGFPSTKIIFFPCSLRTARKNQLTPA